MGVEVNVKVGVAHPDHIIAETCRKCIMLCWIRVLQIDHCENNITLLGLLLSMLTLASLTRAKVVEFQDQGLQGRYFFLPLL